MSPALRRTRPSRRTTVRTAGAGVAVVLGLSGCGTGLQAQTYQERSTSDSTNEAVGALAIRELRVLPPRGRETYPVGSDARVAFQIVNEGTAADRLTAVSADSASSVAVAGPDGRASRLDLPGQSTVAAYAFVLRGLTRELRPGNYVKLDLTFAVNGNRSLLVPVEVTGEQARRREGYKVGETDSTGEVLPEEPGATEGPAVSDPLGDVNGGQSAASAPPVG